MVLAFVLRCTFALHTHTKINTFLMFNVFVTSGTYYFFRLFSESVLYRNKMSNYFVLHLPCTSSVDFFFKFVMYELLLLCVLNSGVMVQSSLDVDSIISIEWNSYIFRSCFLNLLCFHNSIYFASVQVCVCAYREDQVYDFGSNTWYQV